MFQRPGRSGATEKALWATVVAPTPTTRPVQPAEVLGKWSFYVDDNASTVTIDLRNDGRYEQTIVSNHGAPRTCPGGDWTLDGAHLTLTDYCRAAGDGGDTVRWFFGDGQDDWVLYAQDAPDADTMLLARRAKLA